MCCWAWDSSQIINIYIERWASISKQLLNYTGLSYIAQVCVCVCVWLYIGRWKTRLTFASQYPHPGITNNQIFMRLSSKRDAEDGVLVLVAPSCWCHAVGVWWIQWIEKSHSRFEVLILRIVFRVIYYVTRVFAIRQRLPRLLTMALKAGISKMCHDKGTD